MTGYLAANSIATCPTRQSNGAVMVKSEPPSICGESGGGAAGLRSSLGFVAPRQLGARRRSRMVAIGLGDTRLRSTPFSYRSGRL